MTARSAVGICNEALARIGINDPIESLQEDTAAGRACRAAYDPTRRLLLEAHEWHFATRRAQLAELASSRTDWAYVYALPPKLLTALRVVKPGERNPLPANCPAFRLEASEDGNSVVLLTDQEAAELVYVVDGANPTVYTESFVNVFAWRLAAELVLALKNDRTVHLDCLRWAAPAMQAAVVQAAAQRQADPDPISSFEESRR